MWQSISCIIAFCLRDPYIIQTEEMCMEAVKQDWRELQYVTKQTEAICICAVKQNWRALQYVKNQTEGICICAVEQNDCAMQYVENQNVAICLKALAPNRSSYWFDLGRGRWNQVYKMIKYPSPQLINTILKLYPSRTVDILTEYVINLMKTYYIGRVAIVTHIVQHAIDLLYRPNNVNAIVSYARWNTIGCAKSLFLMT